MSDSEAYKIQAGTGQWQREDFPNGSYVEYTYYGADNPSQVGFVWKVEHRKANGELLIGYEYTYDLLGRVEQSVERPSGDTTVYAYTPAGRLESEVREGQVAYSRYYAYNLDGSRQWVLREDAVNGSHWDVYGYDEASGRLAWVQDVWTGEVNKFAWNPEGTLARWSSDEPNSYARVFGYDEEGRLVRIERDYGSGGVQVAYEYGYNSDGVRVWKRDYLAGQEYRYVCRIGCGGIPMRVYRSTRRASWHEYEEYTITKTNSVIYKNIFGQFSDIPIPEIGRLLKNLSNDDLEMIILSDHRSVSNYELSMPYPAYWEVDNGFDFVPAALAWFIKAGALVLVIALLWSTCVLTALASADAYERAFEPGNDKFKHCMAGCLISLCFPIPPLGAGTLFEIFQGIITGFDPDWPIDAVAGEVGIYIGGLCRALLANPHVGLLIGIGGLLSGMGGGYLGCCALGCKATYGKGGLLLR